jgi:glycosyltransferase involved in cell wall biosynthesis
VFRVLLISPRYDGGGAERCARELFERLPELGVETTMWTALRGSHDPSGVHCMRTMAERLLFPADYLPAVNDWRHFGSRRWLDRTGATDFDVVHLHNIHGRWISIEALQRLCRRLPVVWTLHDEWAATGGISYDLTRVMTLQQARRLAGSPRLHFCYASARSRRLERYLARHMPQPRAIVSPSQYVLRLARESDRFPASRLKHVPNGVSLLEAPAIALPREAARSRWRIPAGAKVILLIAAHFGSPFKGMPLAADALNRLAQRPAEGELHVLALGRGAESLRGKLAGGLHFHADFAARSEQLAAAYRAADVTLIPSVADNFPYVALESLACRTPVVAFRLGGFPEILGDDERGLLVDALDTQALAAGVASILENPKQRDAFGERGFRWVSETCGMQHYLQRIHSLYVQVRDESVHCCKDC